MVLGCARQLACNVHVCLCIVTQLEPSITLTVFVEARKMLARHCGKFGLAERAHNSVWVQLKHLQTSRLVSSCRVNYKPGEFSHIRRTQELTLSARTAA